MAAAGAAPPPAAEANSIIADIYKYGGGPPMGVQMDYVVAELNRIYPGVTYSQFRGDRDLQRKIETLVRQSADNAVGIELGSEVLESVSNNDNGGKSATVASHVSSVLGNLKKKTGKAFRRTYESAKPLDQMELLYKRSFNPSEDFNWLTGFGWAFDEFNKKDKNPLLTMYMRLRWLDASHEKMARDFLDRIVNFYWNPKDAQYYKPTGEHVNPFLVFAGITPLPATGRPPDSLTPVELTLQHTALEYADGQSNKIKNDDRFTTLKKGSVNFAFLEIHRENIEKFLTNVSTKKYGPSHITIYFTDRSPIRCLSALDAHIHVLSSILGVPLSFMRDLWKKKLRDGIAEKMERNLHYFHIYETTAEIVTCPWLAAAIPVNTKLVDIAAQLSCLTPGSPPYESLTAEYKEQHFEKIRDNLPHEMKDWLRTGVPGQLLGQLKANLLKGKLHELVEGIFNYKYAPSHTAAVAVASGIHRQPSIVGCPSYFQMIEANPEAEVAKIVLDSIPERSAPRMQKAVNAANAAAEIVLELATKDSVATNTIFEDGFYYPPVEKLEILIGDDLLIRINGIPVFQATDKAEADMIIESIIRDKEVNESARVVLPYIGPHGFTINRGGDHAIHIYFRKILITKMGLFKDALLYIDANIIRSGHLDELDKRYPQEGGHYPSKKSKRSKRNGTNHKRIKMGCILSRKLTGRHLHQRHRKPAAKSRRSTQRRKSNK
jgi:hypothetical protein